MDETPEQALSRALAHWGHPPLTAEARGELARFAAECLPLRMTTWERGALRAYRQNALRHLIATSPDLHLC